ncbi:MAG: helix-turn-helix transcriptional regulator [Thermoplasmata archaeon]|nr:helix-turn-helix transcriptional regulator [Thermoplasmata archaeon]
MEFEIRVVKSSPLTGEDNYKRVAVEFLKQIGYLSENAGEESIAYKLFECFLLHPTKEWTIEELMAKLNATKATVYRHLNKLKGMDILEEGKEGEGKKIKKTYKLRYGNLVKAWNFVEAHVKVAMENYAETVAHLQRLIERRYLE